MHPVGATHQTSVTFSQHDFDEFARLSGDDNPIHVDPEFSARTRFGRTVAHGMLLFGSLSAATTKWLAAPPTAMSQELMFTAPTFADEPVDVTLSVTAAEAGRTEIAQRIIRPDGTQTCVGSARLDAVPQVPAGTEEPPREASRRGLTVGMSADLTRTFTTADISDYVALVDDPNPRFHGSNAIVPTALLGGLISCLLGVELPGPGTNWLKQRFAFHGPVAPDEPVTGRVEVVRLRPDKALVNLSTECSTPSGIVATGEALVLVADLVG